MKAMINRTGIQGIVYQHTLELKKSGPNSANPGTEYITGNLEVATDNAITNIVPVHFTYVTATTSKGNPNATFNTLMDIISGKVGNYMADGDKAGKVKIDSAIGLNEFYSDRSGKEELVSVKRNEGGFVHVVSSLDEDEKVRNTFETDIVITNVRHIEADEEKNIAEKAIVKGAIFDFRKSLLPVEFDVINPNAISYFESLEASGAHPVFTKVKGRQVSEVVEKTITEESAFGEASVRTVKNSRKAWVITWAQREPYEWDDEGSILASELKEAMANRETHLATLKQRQDEYKASKNQAPAAFATASSSPVFNF